jgi:hypothetical protein
MEATDEDHLMDDADEDEDGIDLEQPAEAGIYYLDDATEFNRWSDGLYGDPHDFTFNPNLPREPSMDVDDTAPAQPAQAPSRASSMAVDNGVSLS